MNLLFSYAALWWGTFGIIHLLLPDQYTVSRRLVRRSICNMFPSHWLTYPRWILQANTSYVLWVAAFNVSFLCLNLAVELLGKKQGLSQAEPAIFDALNCNSLAIFLLVSQLHFNINNLKYRDSTYLTPARQANLLTGLINVSMQTMYASDATAVLVLVIYTGVLTTFAWRFRTIRLKI